jgi:hypothetical protein
VGRKNASYISVYVKRIKKLGLSLAGEGGGKSDTVRGTAEASML